MGATTNLTAAQRAKAIRRELKARGITARQVSVRSYKSCWSESVSVQVKDATVSRALVESVARPHESLRRDEAGNLLKGGNVYVEINGGAA